MWPRITGAIPFMDSFVFMYTIDASVDEPVMLIDRHIGFNDEDDYGIDGASFARELMMLDGMDKKKIHVWINSPGGNVMDGYNIYNAILKSKTSVDTKVIGMCASISAVIFQAGRNRVMCDYGILMYHNPFGSENSDALKAMRDSIVKMICERCGMSEDDCMNMMRREPFILSDEAKRMNLCDVIEGSADYNKKRMTAAAVENSAVGYYKEAKNIFNSLLPPKKNQSDMPDFSKIANKLDLVSEASENSILKAIEKIENRATKAETDLAEIKNQLTAKDQEIVKLNGIVNQHKTDKETAERAAKKVEVEKIVNDAADLGKIKNEIETKNAWIEKGLIDKDGTKALLDSIPVNKTSTRIQNQTGAPAGTSAGTEGIQNAAAKAMAQVMNKLEKR